MACGCNGGGGRGPCDHPPIPDRNACLVLTERARFQGRWRGVFTELDPPDGLGPYVQWDVVEAAQRRFVRVCPDGWGPITP